MSRIGISCLAGLCLAIAAILIATPAGAQLLQGEDQCYDWQGKRYSVDERISGCTATIQSYKGKALAWAFVNRGIAWRAKGDHDRAIADYNEAIRLDPKLAKAYVNRGATWYDKKDYDRAIADYNEAIRIEPNADRYRTRGYTYFHKGDFAASASDHLRANDLNDDAYGMLWRYLARAHLGQDGAAELSANVARLKTKEWPYAVIDFYLGRRSQDEMATAASKPDEKCEAAFYTGEWHLLRGDKAQAKASLQIAADSCPKDFTEYAGALAELKRINP